MVKFRILLAVFIIAIIIYTGLVISQHGLNLFQIFFGDILAVTWPGQFNFDFMCLLLLSGLWISWRHQFSFLGLVLGVFAVIGGVMFIAPYLLIATFRTNGSIEKILIGQGREMRK